MSLMGNGLERRKTERRGKAEREEKLSVMVNSFPLVANFKAGCVAFHLCGGSRTEASSTITSTSTFPARSNASVMKKLS